MARKKEFDPLGGSISSEKPKKIRKNNPILGSKEHTGSSSVYDEADHGPLSGYGIDALTADGLSDKPKKRGFLSGIFGQGKSSGRPPEFPTKDHARTPEGEKHSHRITDTYEDDIFENEPREMSEPAVSDPEPSEETYPTSQTFARDQSEIGRSDDEPAPFFLEEKPNPKKQTVRYHPNVCYLCGADTSVPHQQFRFGEESDPENTVPLCKTCMHAVTMLMKYRDPADEREIKSEWRFLAPGLNENRADEIVREGRRRN